MINNEKLENALLLATFAHLGQTDDNLEPHIFHSIRIMEAMRRAGFGHEFMIVALLHDVVEDTTTPLERIFSMFGDEIGDAVDAISRRVGDVTGVPEGYFDSYIPRVGRNPIARAVKLKDLQDNSDLLRYNGKHGLYGRYAKAFGILS